MMRNLFKKTLLGRWNLSCDKITTIKVNWANIDNCGTCSREDLNIKYVDYSTSSNNRYVFEEELIYSFDTYPELIHKSTKMNTYHTGIDYFLTRNKF
jgi:hypothetical protein